ncbi:MAG: hypothetical protein WCJ37_00925 [Syntrophus sp. (in: bacteria)]
MSKLLVGIFTVVFVGALAYELFSRTKPDLAGKLEDRFTEGLYSVLKPSGARA